MLHIHSVHEYLVASLHCCVSHNCVLISHSMGRLLASHFSISWLETHSLCLSSFSSLSLLCLSFSGVLSASRSASISLSFSFTFSLSLLVLFHSHLPSLSSSSFFFLFPLSSHCSPLVFCHFHAACGLENQDC